MRAIRLVLTLAAIMAASVTSLSAAESLKEIEQLPFDDAYQLWLQEQKAIANNLAKISPGSFIIGSTDPTTGVFTPSKFWALTCRLGREASTRESFLLSALATNEWVCEILETSPALCKRYGIESQAAVLFDPMVGYKSVMRSAWTGPEARRKDWLRAADKMGSQEGATTERQPVPRSPDSEASAGDR